MLGLGQTHLAQRRWGEAERALLESAKLNERDPFFSALTVAALGRLAAHLEDFSCAEERLQAAGAAFKQSGSDYYVLAVRLHQSEVALLRGDVARARAHAQAVAGQASNTPDLAVHQVAAHVYLGNVGFQTSNTQLALHEYERAYHTADASLASVYQCQYVLGALLGQLRALVHAGKWEPMVATLVTQWRAGVSSDEPELLATLANWDRELKKVVRAAGIGFASAALSRRAVGKSAKNDRRG
jgi:hypothetical protein